MMLTIRSERRGHPIIYLTFASTPTSVTHHPSLLFSPQLFTFPYTGCIILLDLKLSQLPSFRASGKALQFLYVRSISPHTMPS